MGKKTNRAVTCLWGAAAVVWAAYIAVCVAQERTAQAEQDSIAAGNTTAADTTAADTTAVATPAGADAAGERPVQPDSTIRGDCVPINTGSIAELMELPGVGQVIAERIVAFRTAHGDFENPHSLLEVKGIGPKRLAAIEPLICF